MLEPEGLMLLQKLAAAFCMRAFSVVSPPS
jgi:hypothetical protein